MDSFDEEYADPGSISDKFHFNSVDELGVYLEKNNVYWNPKESKYELKLSIRSEDKNKDVVDEIKSSNNKVENTFEEKVNNNSNKVIGGISSKGKVDMAEMVEYMDILEFLKENKGKLEELLDASNDNGNLPNYAVPGINTTKTFSISAMLSNLIEEYSIGKGVSQKEMLQIAMVEFLMNHGYKEEMQILLNRK